MPKQDVRVPTLAAAKRAATVVPEVGRIPRPVDADGATPALWHACVAYQWDQVEIVDDDADLVVAIGKAPDKIRPADRTKAQIAARLVAERAAAKAEREARPKPARRP